MKTLLLLASLAAAFYLGYFYKSTNVKANEPKTETVSNKKTTELKRVIGVGGIFFKSTDPEKLNNWYKTHLGLPIDEYGARFEWQEGTDTLKKGSLQWSLFSEKTTYLNPSTKDFMINYRVENLSELITQLKKEGVTFADSMSTYDYGKFVHIMDIDGNKIELYEPFYDYKPGN